MICFIALREMITSLPGIILLRYVLKEIIKAW